MTSGVVVDVGHGIVTCAAVWRGEECPHPLSCDPDEATPAKLADMVHTVISGCGKGKNVEMQNALKSSVVITGNSSVLASFPGLRTAFVACSGNEASSVWYLSVFIIKKKFF